MATPGQLVETIAEALGKPVSTITQHDRQLTAAGLRVMKGRGRGAANVTARDAANELVAVLGSDQVNESAMSVEKYQATRPFANGMGVATWKGFPVPELAELPDDHSFVDALEAIIKSFQSGSYVRMYHKAVFDLFGKTDDQLLPERRLPPLVIRVLSPFPVADLVVPSWGIGEFARSVRYTLPYPKGKNSNTLTQDLKSQLKEFEIKQSDLTQYREITAITIKMVADRLNN